MLGAILAVIAILVAIGAGVYARISAIAADRSADAAEAAERRERTPQLSILITDKAEAPCDKAIYRVRNEGPQDLDSVTVYRPRTPDRITYPIAATGRTSWVEDEVDLGPLALTEEVRFTLCCGAAEELPEYLVRIECAAGDDRWTITKTLPPPRPARNPLGPSPDDARAAVELARLAFDEIVVHGGRDTKFFLNDEWREVGRSLRDNAGRVGDRELKARLEGIADIWDKVFALAPPGQYVYDLSNLDRDPGRARRLQQQSDVGHEGQDECEIALRRLNDLQSAA